MVVVGSEINTWLQYINIPFDNPTGWGVPLNRLMSLPAGFDNASTPTRSAGLRLWLFN